jgi:hypothetical protein
MERNILWVVLNSMTAKRWTWECDVGVWIGLSWLRIGALVNAVMNLRVP